MTKGKKTIAVRILMWSRELCEAGMKQQQPKHMILRAMVTAPLRRPANKEGGHEIYNAKRSCHTSNVGMGKSTLKKR